MYNFDPTMSNAANQVKAEQHVITAVNFRDYHYIIPKFAPFFAESLTLKMQYPNGSTRPMIEGKDYYLSFQYMDASATTDHPVYGAISFLDTDTEGVLTIDYHTVGGMWTLTPQQILQILANNLRNPRITSWEQVVNPPERFPPINHPHDIVDFKTMKDVQESVDRVRDAILANSGGGLAAHVGNYANPHNVTKAQVGLGSVLNYGIATTAEAQGGSNNAKYMTPLRVKEAIDILGAALVNAHASRTDNPHNTSKAQVGLGSVENYGVATQAEAIAGTSDAKYMTPLRVKDVVSITNANLASHTGDFDNPHKVTKDQVGLFNVFNYSVATQEEARAGERHDRYMTPLRTTQLVSEYVFTAMKSHSDRTDNPHAVSKQQVNLGNVENYPVATLEEAQAGVRNDRYVTPYLVKQSIGAVSGDLGAHATDTNNPHNTTKAQVGLGSVQNYGVATANDATAATSNILYMTPVRVKEAVDALVGTTLSSHIGNANNPHNVTKAQVGLGSVQNYGIAASADAVAGTSNILYMTPIRVKEAITAALGASGGFAGHMTDTNNPHSTTAAQVGLGSVKNFDIATTAEAQAGTSDVKYSTPLKVKEAIDTLALGPLATHTSNTNNPHGVTKAQVGLGSVQNYGIATTADAAAGTSNIVYMTPVRVKEAITAALGGSEGLTSHVVATNNPHGVTAAQVGLGSVGNYALATANEATAGTSNALYMTPLRVKEAIAASLTTLNAHVSDTNNPHNTTKSQVGLANVENYAVATAAQVVAGTANNLYLTPASLASLRSQITSDLNGHAGRTDNPHAVSAAQVGAYSQAEINTLLASYLKKVDTAPNAILWNGRTELDYGNWLNDQSGIALKATTLGGQTSQQLTDSILSRVGNSFANQVTMQRNGDGENASEVSTVYWVKIHEVTYANMFADTARDGIAFITGGSTSKAGANWTVGQNAILLRTSARAAQTGGQLVECSTLTPTNMGSQMQVGYVLDTTAKKLTTYVQTRYDASDLLVTELCNPDVVVGDEPGTILASAPAGIVYVTPRNLFTEVSSAASAASSAQSAAGNAQTSANAAKSAADAAQTTANTAVASALTANTTANTGVTNASTAQTTANAANTLAGTANTTANQVKTDMTALTARVLAMETLLNGITVS